MQVFSQKVRAEGDQQADQYLRTCVLAETLGYPVLRNGCNPGHADTNRDAAGSNPEERDEGIDGREGSCVYRKLKPGRSDGEARRGSGVNE
jgi:hypothetical protein